MPMFPVPNWTHADYHVRPRAFGSPRSGGRTHAGVDIYAPLYSPIYAIADGTVKLGPYPFYCETNAIEIIHADLDVVVRYGEVAQGKQAVKGLTAGTKVKAGDLIAHVGLLVGITVPSPMLHFEMYSIEASKGTLSGAGPYRRSKYLINATAHVDALLNKSPTPMTARPASAATQPANPAGAGGGGGPHTAAGGGGGPYTAAGGGGGPHTAAGGGGGPGQTLAPAMAESSPTGPTTIPAPPPTHVLDDDLGTAGQYAAPQHRGAIAAVPLKMYFFVKG